MRRAPALAAAAAAGAWLAWAGLPQLAAFACVRRGARDDRRIALTFDDGPDALWTPRILDVLGEGGARGTFFLIGERAACAARVVRAIADGGHEIGNHSWSHRHPWTLGPRQARAEVERGHRAIADLAGTAPRLFRPPWGLINAATFGAVRRCGERCVLWSIQPEGLRPQTPVAQVAHVLERAHPGAIVDLHDADGVPGAPERLAQALAPMIRGLRGAGYELVTVSELLEPAGPR
jgi:peptidoglycan/xylan/chitin deacetylase (PgdA/CDA1 family)